MAARTPLTDDLLSLLKSRFYFTGWPKESGKSKKSQMNQPLPDVSTTPSNTGQESSERLTLVPWRDEFYQKKRGKRERF